MSRSRSEDDAEGLPMPMIQAQFTLKIRQIQYFLAPSLLRVIGRFEPVGDRQQEIRLGNPA